MSDFALMRHGEDPELVLKTFWEEHLSGDFLICPLTAYGEAPRIGLCTKQSLTDALRTAVSIQGQGLNNSGKEHVQFTEWRGLNTYSRVAGPKQNQKPLRNPDGRHGPCLNLSPNETKADCPPLEEGTQRQPKG